MFKLKPLSRTAIPSALAKAERYRLLNEPGEAESICRDVLQLDPAHQEALVMLVLALSDQFPGHSGAKAAAAARDALTQVLDEYARLYYGGIVHERRAKAELALGRPGSNAAVHQGLRAAMSCYERAEALRPEGNDDVILRWNACARLAMELPATEPDIPDARAVQNE